MGCWLRRWQAMQCDDSMACASVPRSAMIAPPAARQQSGTGVGLRHKRHEPGRLKQMLPVEGPSV